MCMRSIVYWGKKNGWLLEYLFLQIHETNAAESGFVFAAGEQHIFLIPCYPHACKLYCIKHDQKGVSWRSLLEMCVAVSHASWQMC